MNKDPICNTDLNLMYLVYILIVIVYFNWLVIDSQLYYLFFAIFTRDIVAYL